MKKNNSVIFKGKKDGIVIVLDEKADFGEIKSVLSEKIIDASSFFKEGKTAITFKGRELSESEESELLGIITDNSDLSIIFSQNVGSGATPSMYANRKGSYALAPEQAIAATLGKNEYSKPENKTYFHMEGLRSGQVLRYGGNIVVMGDVNPGAEIIAEGNIMVMGALKGVAHAGCTGGINCFVAASRFRPIQIRIADKVTMFNKEYFKRHINSDRPLYAYVHSEQIYVSPVA